MNTTPAQHQAQRTSVLYQNSTVATRTAFYEFALAYLCAKQPHVKTGNLEGEESVSFFMQQARNRGFKLGGNPCDFEDLCVALGFTVRMFRAGNAVRRYVGI